MQPAAILKLAGSKVISLDRTQWPILRNRVLSRTKYGPLIPRHKWSKKVF